MKRWLLALAALAIGGGVSAALLIGANPARDTVEAYFAARDLPAGSMLAAGALSLERVKIAGDRSLLFIRGDEGQLAGQRASHDLGSGQLIQRSDVMGARSFPDRRLVFVPVKDAPIPTPGSRVDLLVIGGTSDSPAVFPLALGVEVRSAVPGGLVVVVEAKSAAAFVYAAETMRLTAVIAEPGAADGAEVPISSPDQAMATAAQR